MFLEKVLADSYYGKLYKEFGEDYIYDAGYYDNNNKIVDIESTLDIMCTPLDPVITGYMKCQLEGKEPCIIIETGSFCPIHDGHVEAIEKAREACRKAGYEPIAGYICPDHDDYVLSKVKNKGLNINKRIGLIHKMIADSDWLRIDPWPGIFCDHELNFTEIMDRLEAYIEKHVGIKVPIFYVCGADNARFCKTFKFKGHCVVIDRPGFSSEVEKYREYIDDKRVLYIYHNNTNSSTKVRNENDINIDKKTSLDLRVEGKDPREKLIVYLLMGFFERINIKRVSDQLVNFNKLNVPIVSLDSLIKGDFNLEISRQYDYFGINHIKFVERPGSDKIKEQVKKINLRNCFLFDDDIDSGNTINQAKQILNSAGINVDGVITFTKSEKNREILDVRDFFFDHPNGGLVIMDPYYNKPKRFPYVYPYVNPYIRASIDMPLAFSICVWQINMYYFENRDKNNYEICKKNYNFLLSLSKD